jgi:hypothetical protein
MHDHPGLSIVVHNTLRPYRCYNDANIPPQASGYRRPQAIATYCWGSKNVPVDQILEGKTYLLLLAHNQNAQAYNQAADALRLSRKASRMIRLWSALRTATGQRILGLAFMQGLSVHTTAADLRRRTGAFNLPSAHYIGSVRGLKAV